MHDPDHLLEWQDERKAFSAALSTSRRISSFRSAGTTVRQSPFGFDLDAEYPLLFVAPDAASEKDGPAVRARIHGRLQHRIAPSLAHNGYD